MRFARDPRVDVAWVDQSVNAYIIFISYEHLCLSGCARDGTCEASLFHAYESSASIVPVIHDLAYHFSP